MLEATNSALPRAHLDAALAALAATPGVRLAEPAEAAFLHGANQSALNIGRNRANFVDEQRAAIC